VLIIKLLQKGHYFKPSLHKNSLIGTQVAEELNDLWMSIFLVTPHDGKRDDEKCVM
jgi:hypothetical protein